MIALPTVNTCSPNATIYQCVIARSQLNFYLIDHCDHNRLFPESAGWVATRLQGLQESPQTPAQPNVQGTAQTTLFLVCRYCSMPAVSPSTLIIVSGETTYRCCEDVTIMPESVGFNPTYVDTRGLRHPMGLQPIKVEVEGFSVRMGLKLQS